MEVSRSANATVKVFYRPIEAAIRWSGLSRFEPRILSVMEAGELPEEADIPQWSLLRLNAARLRDALLNGDLCYGKYGVTCNDPSLLNNLDLTIRHVDLKAWMRHFYPDERPEFLFDALERHLHPAISADSVQALIADREALRVQLADRTKAWDALRAEFQTLTAAQQTSTADKPGDTLGLRSEGTYLNIVGGLLTLMLGKSPGGIPHSSFENQEAVVNALTAHFGDRPGMSERTLWSKFAAARRHLSPPRA